MYNVGDRVSFKNLQGGSWAGATVVVWKIEDMDCFWFKQDNGMIGNLQRGQLKAFTELFHPISLENK